MYIKTYSVSHTIGIFYVQKLTVKKKTKLLTSNLVKTTSVTTEIEVFDRFFSDLFDRLS